MKLEWRNNGGEWIAWIPISDDRKMEVSAFELSTPDACEVIINLYRGHDFVAQTLCVKVRLTIGRAKQLAARLANELKGIV